MPNPIPGADDITRRVLPNGIVVLVRENFDAQSVVVTGSFAGGAIFENPAQAGIASLTAEATMYGTRNHDYETIHETLESAGMSLEVSAGRYLSSFDGKALAEDLPALLDLLGDVLQHPVFPPEHVQVIRAQAVTGLKYNLQNTRYMANRAFFELTYPENHIQYRGSTGTLDTLSALTPADMAAYHEKQYGPGAMIVVVVGAVKAEKALAEVERVLGSWQNPAQHTDFTQPDVPRLSKVQFRAVALPGKTQSDIVLGVPGPSRYSEDYVPASVINHVLGVFGMFGRLGKSVREEQGLAYYCYSSIEGGLHQGPWRVVAGVNPNNVKQAVDSIRVEIEQMIKTPISPDDLADSKANLTGRLPLRLESNEGVAANLLAMERYHLGLDYLRQYNTMINALTVGQLQTAMQSYWQPDAFSLAVAGPELNGAAY